MQQHFTRPQTQSSLSCMQHRKEMHHCVQPRPRVWSSAARMPRLRVASSVDPLSVSDGVYRPGRVFTIHGPAQLQDFTTKEPGKSKLTVLMAKSSTCRPCKKYMATYHSLAECFADCQVLEILGDENKETRKMMMDMKVKSTPTFFLYRNGNLIHTQTGTASNALPRAIVERLSSNEAGRDWKPPVLAVDSDEED